MLTVIAELTELRKSYKKYTSESITSELNMAINVNQHPSLELIRFPTFQLSLVE